MIIFDVNGIIHSLITIIIIKMFHISSPEEHSRNNRTKVHPSLQNIASEIIMFGKEREMK